MKKIAELHWDTLEQLENIAIEILELYQKLKFSSVWVWEGALGAGKTTLIKHLCKKLQVIDTVQSPTFSLINEYKTIQNHKIYHIDCYRVQTEEELFDIGFEEYLYSENLCFVEWGTKFMELLPTQFILFRIEFEENLKRKLIIYENN
jgi:tRNA threonylcarbamoyladenosine biosynthesis protein TsaE